MMRSLTGNGILRDAETMKVETWEIDRVTPYPRNARKVPERAIEQVAASIENFGWRVPIVVDKNGVIICGHTRLLAAKKLGLTRVPVHVAANLTPAQVRAYRLMDNRSHEETDWDLDLLVPEMQELRVLDFNLELTGFDAREIDELLADPQQDGRANTVPELPKHPVTKPGDVWRCGNHRVLCGDSTAADAVSRACGPTKPFLMVTDPPYGVDYNPMWREEAGLGKQRQTGKVANDDQIDWTAAYKLFPGAVIYVWHAGVHATKVAVGIETAGFEIRSQIIWSKQHFAMSRGNYHWQHEPCWYAVRKGQQSNWNGDRSQSTIWQVPNLNPMGGDRNEKATGHGTQKPVELMRRPIVNHTKRGEAVYDPFLGSGTTMMAAELTERVCIGIDIDPRYVDVTVMRFQEFMGQEPTLEETGRTFRQVRAQRAKVRCG
jgi:DNA modification methylase